MIQKFINLIATDNKKEAERKIAMLKEEGKVPVVMIINTNKEDEPSHRYIKNKCRELEAIGISYYVTYAESDGELCDKIFLANSDSLITSVIVQAPFGPGITMDQQKVFDMVVKEKDVDRLHSCWFYDKDFENLPLTACGIYKLVERISMEEKLNIMFYGNGLTTNRRLFLKMFDEGKHDCFIANSKTSLEAVNDMIQQADLIIAASGRAETLKCKDKIVISPTIVKTKEGFRSDLAEECRAFNTTHEVLGSIGKLTVTELLKRAASDALKQEEELLIKKFFNN